MAISIARSVTDRDTPTMPQSSGSAERSSRRAAPVASTNPMHRLPVYRHEEQWLAAGRKSLIADRPVALVSQSISAVADVPRRAPGTDPELLPVAPFHPVGSRIVAARDEARLAGSDAPQGLQHVATVAFPFEQREDGAQQTLALRGWRSIVILGSGFS